MEVNFRDANPEKLKADVLAIPVKEGDLDQKLIRSVDRLLKRRLSERVEKAKFKGAEGTALAYSTAGLLPAAHLLLLGMGKESGKRTDAWRKAAAKARREVTAVGGAEVAFVLPPEAESPEVVGAIVEGMLLASYHFDRYRAENRTAPAMRSLTLVRSGLKQSAALKQATHIALDLIPGVYLARDLVNEPPSATTARYLALQAQKHCTGRGVSVEVWNKKKIEAQHLAGLLAVNRGSIEEPRFIHIRYRPPGKAHQKVALIGKGITFDSGGLSLKTAKGMETMKLDMAGAAAIIGAMSVIDKLRPPVEVTGYIPCTDNLPSGSAQKPGDIIRYLNDKTVEVLNTDAEGRLILADALALAAKEKPDYMINLATLTGACMVALGTEVAGIFGNRQPLVDEVIRCGHEAGEKLWQLPLVKEYREEIKSSVADIKNVGGSYGGAITAALFLQEFVDDLPWAHLDIAGPAFAEKDTPTCPKGGTGFGVLTLLKFLASNFTAPKQ
jgi:leucyl aminopeptidase